MRLLVLVATGSGHPSARLATALVASAPAAKFDEVTAFFHGDGATHAIAVSPPGDEWSACERWQALAAREGTFLWVCPTSWARRAGETAPSRAFELRSLGEFALRLAEADRVVRL